MAVQRFGVKEEEKVEGAENCSEIRTLVCASGGFSVWLWVSGVVVPMGTEGGGKRWGLIDTKGDQRD